MNFNLEDPVHLWALAILDNTTQLCGEVMRALLDVAFEGQLAVVVISRRKHFKLHSDDALKPAVKWYEYSYNPVYQPTVLPGASVAIAVMHESADPSEKLADQTLDNFITQQATDAVVAEAQGGVRRSKRNSQGGQALEHQRTQQLSIVSKEVVKKKNELVGGIFASNVSMSHFTQLRLLGGTDGLPV